MRHSKQIEIEWDQVGSSGIKWDQVGSSGINFDPDSEIVRFGAIFEYCCDIVRILFLGAIFSDFWQKLRFVAVGLP